MNRNQSSLRGVGGLRIFWQSWLPDGQPRALVVLAHGVSEHSNRYQHVAERLVNEGFGVYALDHRGHGHSEGPRALIDRVDNAVADLDALVVEVAGRHPGSEIFLLGHSMGGALALSYTFKHQDRLTGLMLSGPLAALEAAPAHQRIAARVLSVVAPRLPLFPIESGEVSRDPAVVEEYTTDPLVYHGKLPVRTVAELAGAIESFPARAPSITIPTLIMYGTADHLCPPEGSLMLGERIGAVDKTVKSYDGLYHEILNEPERDRVMDDMCEWLTARSSRSPARTDTP